MAPAEHNKDYTFTTSQYASTGRAASRRAPTRTIPTTRRRPRALRRRPYVPMFAHRMRPGTRWRDLNRDGTDDLSAGNGDFEYDNSWWADWEWRQHGRTRSPEGRPQIFPCQAVRIVERGSGKGPELLLHHEPRSRRSRTSRSPPARGKSSPLPSTLCSRRETPTFRKARPGAGASFRLTSRSPRARQHREGQRQGRHRADRRRQHLWRPGRRRRCQ